MSKAAEALFEYKKQRRYVEGMWELGRGHL